MNNCKESTERSDKVLKAEQSKIILQQIIYLSTYLYK